MNKELIGEKLKYVRDLKKLSMDNLKDEFNKNYGSRVSKSMISNWENGRYLISNKNLNLYSRYFEVYSSYFLNDDVKPLDFYTHNEIYKQYSKYTNLSFDYDFGEEGLNYRKSIRNDIYNLLLLLNVNGLKKVKEYASDLLYIEDYILDESDKD